MSDGLRRHIDEHNKSNLEYKVPHISSSFVRAGEKPTKRPTAFSRSFLIGASDWKILTDYHHAHLVFPPDIISTNLRPDIVIWSPSVKKVLLLELTCPAEEGFATASVHKLERYNASPLDGKRLIVLSRSEHEASQRNPRSVASPFSVCLQQLRKLSCVR